MKTTTRFSRKSWQHTKTAAVAAALAGTSLSACTGQVPESFRYAQLEENFGSQSEINTKIDLLFVVDNSASMGTTQTKLRQGFTAFAEKYMQPTWDIRVAVITTDTYLGHSAWTNYLNLKSHASGSTSAYISGRKANWENPSWNRALLSNGVAPAVGNTGAFPNGVKIGEEVPAYSGKVTGSATSIGKYSRLLAGLHDGPIPTLCSEHKAYFFVGELNCRIRDAATANRGPEHCLNPGSGETAVTQCVNTVQNDTIHSGKAIISTLLPAGRSTAEWTQELINNFQINVTTGSAGEGSERGLASVSQLLADNETSETAFFRRGSARGIIFVTDEDDQSMELPSPVPSNYTPNTDYLSATFSAYPDRNVTSNPCPSKTVDGLTYKLTTCPIASKLIPVQTYKSELDAFFKNLDQVDGVPAADPNYFVTVITPTTRTTLEDFAARRASEDNAVGNKNSVSVDEGTRYIALANLVGNGSMTMDIGAADYTPVLDAIGRASISKRSTFHLTRAPTSTEDMIVFLKHADGSREVIPTYQYVIEGKSLRLVNYNFVLSLKASDNIIINYQPKTAY